jgi:hypothetical protein
MLTVKEILTNKVALDIECIDRVYLNGYVKHLQMAGGLITCKIRLMPHSDSGVRRTVIPGHAAQ